MVLRPFNGWPGFVFGTAAPVSPHTTSGQLRGLAVTGSRCSVLLADLPAMAEGGLRDVRW
ncbi:MAG: hypothetical protein HY525_07130 [Betaproteobacteria bacterium]|nr:hypothetical protein [Betaproteobacteria bacterium]